MAAITLRNVVKRYGRGKTELQVIHGVNAEIMTGEFIVIVGGDAANEWNLVMATAVLALLPPAAVVVLMQKWFVKGLVDTEK